MEATGTVAPFLPVLAARAALVIPYVVSGCVAAAGVGLAVWGIRKAYRAFRGM